MTSNYYTMRDAKVRIAEELSKRGWEIIGFKDNESDMMTDYYSPANWDGIATKNGFILCIDTPYEAKSVPIKKYNYNSNSLSFSNTEKIKKLEMMTVEHGATAEEEQNAKAKIEKIKNSSCEAEKEEIIGYTTAHMANPGKCKWHIEKDNSIYDKGTGITKYADVPESYVFDIDKMEFKEGYKYYTNYDNERMERTLKDEELKAVKDLKVLILRWERVINAQNGMYDGTEENKQQADAQTQIEKMEKVIEKVTKKVLKMVEVTRENIQVGDYLSFSWHGGYWKVTNEYMKKGTWKGVTESRNAFDYERVGVASRGYQQLKNTQKYYQYEYQLLKEIEEDKIKIYELKEVEEITEVEKWVRIKSQTTAKKEKSEETKIGNSEPVEVVESNNNYNFTITKEQDTRDNSDLWVVRLSDKLEHEQWKEYDNYMKSKKGYYSKFKKGHIFKFNPTEILIPAEQKQENNINEEVQKTQNENPYEPEFKEGYIYNVHFKEWNMSIEQIKESLSKLAIEFEMCGENKVAIKNLSYEMLLQVKKINDDNVSILFKDDEYLIEDVETAQNLIDTSTTIIKMLNLDKMEYITSIEYKQALTSYLLNNNIKINKCMLQYLYDEGYIEFEKVLIDLLTSENVTGNTTSKIVAEDNEKLEFKQIEIGNTTVKTDDEPVINQELEQNIINMNDYKKVDEQKGNDDTMSIFDKFEDIKIENTERISSEDKLFCEDAQKNYNEASNLLMSMIDNFKTVTGIDLFSENRYNEKSKNKYIDWYKYKDMTEWYKKLKGQFISDIIYYFEQKYNVTIESVKIKDKYDYTLTYNNILDEIFEQLGGCTFEEKAKEEIKEFTRNIYYYNDYRKSSNINIKKNKLIIDNNYVHFDSIWKEYRLSGNFGKIFTALYLFDSDIIVNGNTELHKEYCGYENERNQYKYDKFEPTSLTKVTGIKFFKNGKLEIEFLNSQYAEQFAKEYCGYIEKVA